MSSTRTPSGIASGDDVTGASRAQGEPEPMSHAAFTRQLAHRRRMRKVIAGTIAIAVAVILWQVISDAYDLHLLLPGPWMVVTTLFKILTLQTEQWPYGGNVYTAVGSSLVHAGIGFGIAALLAIPLGLLVGRVRWMSESVGLVLRLLYPIPGIAWIPLAILWFGLSSTTLVFVVGITTFFPLFYNAEAGARYVDQTLVDTARCFGRRGIGLMAEVVIPASLPNLVTGLRLAIGDAWRVIVAAEIIAGQRGIGYILEQSQLYFRAADLMSFMIVISVIGYATQLLIAETLERRTIAKWGTGAREHDTA